METSPESMRPLALISVRKLRRQLREGVLLDDVYVSRGDSVTGVNIVTEVGVPNRLESLRLTEIGVATGYNFTRVNVAQEHADLDGNVVCICPIVHAKQGLCDPLLIGQAGEIHSYRCRCVATGAANAPGARSDHRIVYVTALGKVDLGWPA